MEVMKDENSQSVGELNAVIESAGTPAAKKISGVELREKVLEPYYIVGDYNGFSIYEETKGKSHKLLGPMPQVQQAVMDIIKRKVGHLDTVMTLDEYNTWIQNMIAFLQPKSIVQ